MATRARSIRVYGHLFSDARLIRLANLLELDLDVVIARLIRLWCWARASSDDGRIPGFTLAMLDGHITLTPGFADALVVVGWLVVEPDALVFRDWQEWSGPGEHSDREREQSRLRQRRVRERQRARDVGSNGAGSEG